MLRFRRVLSQLFLWHGWPTVVSVATAVAAIAALFFTAQSLNANSDQYHLAQRGQVSERFATAVEQLAAEQPEVRLGGIYSLEQLALDSPQDHGTVFEVLTAFVRSHATIRDDPRCSDPLRETDNPRAQHFANWMLPPNPDLTAALDVVGRRNREHDRFHVDLRQTCLAGVSLNKEDWTRAILVESKLLGADMRGTNLTAANLVSADLRGADMRGTNLTSASLSSTDLRGADLDHADLTYANLSYSDSRGANFTRANLTDVNVYEANLSETNLSEANLHDSRLHRVELIGADLSHADLTGMHLSNSNLDDADLSVADLRGTILIGVDLSGANLAGALLSDIEYDRSTVWPAGFTPPPSR